MPLAQMLARFFGPKAAAERRERLGLDKAGGGLPPGEVQRRIHWQNGRKRGYTEERIAADWAVKCERLRRGELEQEAGRRKPRPREG